MSTSPLDEYHITSLPDLKSSTSAVVLAGTNLRTLWRVTSSESLYSLEKKCVCAPATFFKQTKDPLRTRVTYADTRHGGAAILSRTCTVTA